MFLRAIILTVLSFLFFVENLSAQNKWKLYEQSFLTGWGWGKDSLNVPEGSYHPLFFNYRIGFTHPKLNFTASKKIDFEIFCEPQFNLVILSPTRGENKVYRETGVNFGYQSILNLNRFFSVSTYISSGPHYFNVPTSRQATGFIFCDSMGAACWMHLSKFVYVNVMFKIRHMSNANTRYPNQGINTLNALIGFGITY